MIAVARDAAFSFLYEENLDLLCAAGAEIAFFSPLSDSALPSETAAIYLGGGFPELYAAHLSANTALRAAISAAAADDLPIYAECGGLMYCTEALIDQEGRRHPMLGLLPGRSVMTPRLTLGYRTVRVQTDSWLWNAGETVRGHEFHYSVGEDRPAAIPWLYTCQPDAFRPEARPEGAQQRSVLASYVHLHWLACPQVAARFVAAAQRYWARRKTCHGVPGMARRVGGRWAAAVDQRPGSDRYGVYQSAALAGSGTRHPSTGATPGERPRNRGKRGMGGRHDLSFIH
ncbi:hypothetical protein HC891_24000 [Candidatus Gracilibacteria bacterium]|nr:hypothetical protein [Candidatus Gracilibacteria bacterium]